MTVALTMIARDEEQILPRAIESARGLVDHVYVVDTGSTDGTVEVARDLGATVAEVEWAGFAAARTAALRLAKGADWTLMVDADETIEFVPELPEWLATEAPSVDAFMVMMDDGKVRYRMPRLTGRGVFRYEGPTHEWLEGATDTMPMYEQSLTIRHHADGKNRQAKHERDIDLLADGVTAGDPRSTYYTAQALWCLGHEALAAAMYERRAEMTGTFEEERWHARYMAARLLRDVDGLIVAYRERPSRPEPLRWAARIVTENGLDASDVLFRETAG